MKAYYLKRRVIEMINGYSLIFPEPLVACDGTEYYSCRAPDGEFALLVSCKDRQHYKNLARKLKKLGKRERSLCRFSCASDSDETTKAACPRRQECTNVRLIPYLTQLDEEHGQLRLRCYDLAQMVKLDQIMKKFYLDLPTAYRVIFHLATLVERLILMQVSVPTEAENLVLDRGTAHVTLLDWSKAVRYDTLPFCEQQRYYRSLYDLARELTGASYEDGQWTTAVPCDETRLLKVFTLLSKLDQTDDQEFDSMDAAIDQMKKVSAQQHELLDKMNILAGSQMKARKPYQLKHKN